MSATLRITPAPETGSVLLEIDRDGLGVLRIVRTDANGTAEVRGNRTQLPAPAGAGLVILSDYEAAAGAVFYRVELEGGQILTESAVLVLESPWLGVPLQPHHSEPVEAVMSYSAARPGRGTVHVVLGREDPLPNLRGLGTRSGSLVFPAGDLPDALRIERVFSWAQVVMLRGMVPGMDMYLVPEDVAHAPVQNPGSDEYTYEVTVGYVQVARPSGAQDGALGWTFAALAAAHESFNAVRETYPSFDDLTLNRPRGTA